MQKLNFFGASFFAKLNFLRSCNASGELVCALEKGNHCVSVC